MSSVFKSVKKVFKKVIKTVKKIAPVILAAVAIYFTAGAALAAMTPAVGTVAAAKVATAAAGVSTGIFGGISSAVVTGLSVTSPVIAGVINGAITYGITGAAMGGVTAAIKGGDIGKGILYGGLTGAAGGAIFGGISAYAAQPAAGAAGNLPALPKAPVPEITGPQINRLASTPLDVRTAATLAPPPPPSSVAQNVAANAPGAGQVSFGSNTLPQAPALARPVSASVANQATAVNQAGVLNRAGVPYQGVARYSPMPAKLPPLVPPTALEQLGTKLASLGEATGITTKDVVKAGFEAVKLGLSDDSDGRPEAARIAAKSAIDQQENAARLVAQNYGLGSGQYGLGSGQSSGGSGQYSGGSSPLGRPQQITTEVKPFTGGNIRRNPVTNRYEYVPRQFA